MSAFLRRTAKPDQLLLFRPGGGEVTRELPNGTLDALLKRMLASGGNVAALQWEHSRQLGLSFLKEIWWDVLAMPESAYLREVGKPAQGRLELQVDVTKDVVLREYAEDLMRMLAGRPKLQEVVPAPAPEPAPAPAPEPAPEPMVDVVMPGERVVTSSGRQWEQDSGDLFGLAGEPHPDDLVDHGLEIQEADLPWLNPGDAIISPRRGPCRIKRVEDDAAQVVAKDENGQMVVLEFRELVAEFQFDDGN
ncbi:MAG: hypothetical protein O3A95_07640 [Planctomycetota bacterium]|nr:hypothetical protein [Planctomycetota bacterium]MDA1114153.1 hypothetical protein [Planctomycetota bacterium]